MNDDKRPATQRGSQTDPPAAPDFPPAHPAPATQTTAPASRTSTLATAACVAGALLVFATDLLTPPGFAHGMLYPPLIVAAALTRRRALVLGVTWTALGLMVVGAGLSWTAGAPVGMLLADRALSTIVIGIVGALSWLLLDGPPPRQTDDDPAFSQTLPAPHRLGQTTEQSPEPTLQSNQDAESLQQAQKLESLGQLTGGVAHDFNNLLTIIQGNAELLTEQLSDRARERILAEMITNAAQRGAEMTQRLLAFARRQALEPRVVDVNRLVADMDRLLRRTLGEHIDIEQVRAGGLWTTLVDPGQLENVLLNLALNARDAMPNGGRLTVETANTRLDEAYAEQHPDVRPGQYVMVAVSDTGQGIPADILSRVFEPFFTTKAPGKGTGLGLAMVYGFVKQSRGHVAIYSETGRGTTVKIYLPRMVKGQVQPAQQPPQVPVRAGQGQVVLLVEDDDLVRAFAHTQLVDLGYDALVAQDGPSAMQWLRERPDIALLFTDIVMPGGMSGRELADAAHALRPDLPVLYTSGYTEDAIVHHGRLDPGVILLSKPYRRADLAHKLQEALRQGVEAPGPLDAPGSHP